MPSKKAAANNPSVADGNVRWLAAPPRPPRRVDQTRMDSHERQETSPPSQRSVPRDLRSSHGAAAVPSSGALHLGKLGSTSASAVPRDLMSSSAVPITEASLQQKRLQTVKDGHKNAGNADKASLFGFMHKRFTESANTSVGSNPSTSNSQSQNKVDKITPEGKKSLQQQENTLAMRCEQISMRETIRWCQQLSTFRYYVG